jgi:hypothetical protein
LVAKLESVPEQAVTIGSLNGTLSVLAYSDVDEVDDTLGFITAGKLCGCPQWQIRQHRYLGSRSDLGEHRLLVGGSHCGLNRKSGHHARP